MGVFSPINTQFFMLYDKLHALKCRSFLCLKVFAVLRDTKIQRKPISGKFVKIVHYLCLYKLTSILK